MCLLFCFVLFWILCCVVCEKKKKKKLLIKKKKHIFQVNPGIILSVNNDLNFGLLII